MASLQVLTAFTALSSPVKVTDAKTLAADMSALADLGFSDLRAVSIVCKIDELNAYSGTDYTSNHAQLMQDAKSFMGGFSLMDHQEPLAEMQMRTAMDWGAAKAKNASLSTDVAALLNTGRDFMSAPLETLNKVYLFLRYKLALLSV